MARIKHGKVIHMLAEYEKKRRILTKLEHSLPYFLNISLRHIEGESVMLLSEEDVGVVMGFHPQASTQRL